MDIAYKLNLCWICFLYVDVKFHRFFVVQMQFVFLTSFQNPFFPLKSVVTNLSLSLSLSLSLPFFAYFAIEVGAS
jgi:hypothetical protein